MTEQNQNEEKHRDGKGIIGVFFLIIGALLLAYKMGAGIPGWLFTWPCILITVGIFSGVKHRFENFSWLVMVGIGTLFLINNEFVDLNLQEYILPIIFIGAGILFITRPKHRWRTGGHWKNKKHWENKWQHGTFMNDPSEADKINITDGEYIEVNSVFGGAKRIILSKNFKGGEINCFFGGAEIDLTQADIQGPVIIEAHQVFGGTKLVIPPHWDFKTEVTNIFGGMEDKRKAIVTQVDTSKILILKGSSIFGGVEIKSY